MNMRIRLQSKAFWVGIISALFLFLEAILPLFGITIDIGGCENVLNSALSLLAAIGVLTDVTTPTLKDSDVTMLKKDLYQTAQEVLDENCDD